MFTLASLMPQVASSVMMVYEPDCWLLASTWSRLV